MDDFRIELLGMLTYLFFCLAFLVNGDLSYFERLIYMGVISWIAYGLSSISS